MAVCLFALQTLTVLMEYLAYIPHKKHPFELECSTAVHVITLARKKIIESAWSSPINIFNVTVKM